MSDSGTKTEAGMRKRGKLIGWKKLQDRLIAKLEIPSTAKRIMCDGPERKCRAERVKVLEIHIGCPMARKWNAENGQTNMVTSGVSGFSKAHLIYDVGKIVTADMFDPNPHNPCSHGINFFLTREEAERFGPP